MNKFLIPVLGLALAIPAATVVAQPGPGNNPFRNLEDFFGRMERNNPNPALGCVTQKRLNRRGDIVWLRMECNSYDRR